ncbi:hypothetical protein R1sor_021817 [Riccia sorocarpa]|uniref:Uncharacterized protein n=1 Tax=Riccia sorocarpa TaxID=122646 RepID=A0ABD3GJK2_9MARC
MAKRPPHAVLSCTQSESRHEIVIPWQLDSDQVRSGGKEPAENNLKGRSPKAVTPEPKQKESKEPGVAEEQSETRTTRNDQESEPKCFSADTDMGQQNHQEVKLASLAIAEVIQTVPLSSLNLGNLTGNGRLGHLSDNSATPLKEATLLALESNLLPTPSSASTLLLAGSVLNQEKENVDCTASPFQRDSPGQRNKLDQRTESGYDGKEVLQADGTERDARYYDESCVSVVNYSNQVEPSERKPELSSRPPSPNLEFDVETLLKQDLFPDLVLSAGLPEDTESNWVFIDSEFQAGVTVHEKVRDQELPDRCIIGSCPDSQERVKRRRFTSATDASSSRN